MLDKLNTLFVISKGRPKCTTAHLLQRIGFPGDWYIVCGSNDETVPQYEANYPGHVLVFDFGKEFGQTDTMDNFGLAKSSGACPARNATAKIAAKMGLKRHWQFDDDYTGFNVYDPARGKNRTSCDGPTIYEVMKAIASFADSVGASNAGFTVATMECRPDNRMAVARRVFNAHNMPVWGDEFVKWTSRMNDDLINAVSVAKRGGYEAQFKFAGIAMKPSQQEDGGLSDLYREEGTVFKTAYAVMANPSSVKLVRRFGRWHHSMNASTTFPKVVRCD